MGGSIWVESCLGAGSTFHFTMLLPWADEAPPPQQAPQQALPSTASSGEQNPLLYMTCTSLPLLS
jgi:hypothetical protein